MKSIHFLPVLFSLLLVFILFVFSVLMFETSLSNESETVVLCGVSDSPYYANSSYDRNILDEGKSLFQRNCAQCHAKDMETDATGPALKGSIKRWDYDTLALVQYLINPSAFFINNPQHRIIELNANFGGQKKNNHKHLNHEQIKAILAYIEVIPIS